jgi:hypothetical protein
MVDVLNDQPYHHAGSADYSATSLVMSPRQLQLKKRYGDRIKDDVQDRWYIFLGNALHEYIERALAKMPNKYIVERKITEFIKDRKVVAKLDAYDVENDILYDHKSATHWAWGDPAKEEYEQQLNINAWFMRQAGYQPVKAILNMLTKDWSAGMAKFKGEDEYPPNPMWELDVPLWSEQEQEDFINQRLDMHMEHEETSDEDLPFCTNDEMWAKDSTWAVKAPGVYKAKRVLKTKKEAEDWLAASRTARPDWYIEERPGERTRCAQYCNVNKFCNQYQEYLDASKDG